MPLLQTYVSPRWGIWKIEEPWETLFSLLEQPDEYLPFLNRCKSESRKAEWLAVRLLLKELTGSATAIAYHPSGSPCLPGSPLHISISHTKGFAAVLLSPANPVGIDIEYRSERIRKLTSRFLNESERALSGDHPSTVDLLICWSAKETVFKMTGLKAADWLKDIHIKAFERAQDSGCLTVQELLTPQSATFRIHYDVTPDFVLTRSE
jgi:phosphopantetheinyl transferase